MSIRHTMYHLINGIRSGIPLCCVLFFVKKQRTVEYVAYEVDLERGLKVKWQYNGIQYEDSPKNMAHYVQCDKCFEKDYIHPLKSNGVILTWLIE